MPFRRAVLLAVVIYLTADYCDPSVPGVFSFETESFFVDSIESRSALRPFVPTDTAQLPALARDTITPPRRSFAPARVEARAGRVPHPPRAQIIASPPAAPGASEDH